MATLMTEDRLDSARRRCRSPEFEAATRALERSAQTFMSLPLAPAAEPAGFYHDYFCPDHAVELRFDAQRPTLHVCPQDGRTFSGEPYDSAWRWFLNNRLSTCAFELALLYRLGDDGALLERHSLLQRTADILTAYAHRYPRYPDPAEREYGRGRATFQSLDEAVWLIPLIRAYDLIRQALDADVCRQIEADLIRPAAEHLVGEKYNRIHNIECWHNTAIGAAGLCLEDATYTRIALEDDFGFHHQLAEGVAADGLWWEGSSSYHFYALAALVTMAQVWEGTDDSLLGHPRLRCMFKAPVDLVSGADLRLPATNDCWFFSSLLGDVCHGVPQAASFYEVALDWYGDPRFAWVLERNYRNSPRASLEALLYGADFSAESTPFRPAASLFATTGLAVLRSPHDVDEQTTLLLKYGPHGGGHGHPDKLAVSLWARGCPLALDLGTPGYGIRLNEAWYRQTISHNTVVIDARSQPPACGELITFDDDAVQPDDGGTRGFAVADARVRWDDGNNTPYAGVTMRRTLLLVGDYFVDIFDVSCQRNRQIDWICHFHGDRPPAPAQVSASPIDLQGDGYENVSRAVVADAPPTTEFKWRLARDALTLFLPFETDTQLISGTAPANPASDTCDILIRRRSCKATTFVAVFCISADEPTVSAVQPLDNLEPGHWGFVVHGQRRRDLWLVGQAPHADDTTRHAAAADRVFTYDLTT